MASNPTFKLSAKHLPNFLGEAALRAHRRWQGAAGKEARDKILKQVGSPGFRPSKSQAKQIEIMAAMGLLPKEIGTILGIETKLIEFFYTYELKTAKLRASLPVAKAALEMASDKRHPDMTKFWLQCNAGWTPSQQIDHTGIDKDADDARAAREKLLEGDDVQTPSKGRA